MNTRNNPKDFLRHLKQMARTFIARGGIHEAKLDQSNMNPKNHFNFLFVGSFFRSLVDMGVLDGAAWLELTGMALDVYGTNETVQKHIRPNLLKFTGDNYYILESLRHTLTENEADCFIKIFFLTCIAHQNSIITAEIRQKIEGFIVELFNIKVKK